MLFTGIGPLLAWRRVSWASARRVFRLPLAVAAVAAVALALFTDSPQKPWAYALFVFAAFALAGLAQEFWNGAAARRRLAGGSLPGALVAVVSRNRRRYGGYIVHIGFAVLLIGVAASSSFQTNREFELRPGQSIEINGREITYLEPTMEVAPEKLSFGALLGVSEGGKRVTTLNPSRDYFRPTGQESGEIATFFAGESTSEVGLKAGFTSDLWTAMQPDLDAVQRRVRAADAGFRACLRGGPGTPPQCKALATSMRAAAANPALQPAALTQIASIQTATAERIARTYLDDPTPATFKVIVDPLVTWMWIGGLICLSGALIALWPARGRRRGALVRTEADALKEAKYREIRDAELDHAAGKLSDEDFAVLDAELRREAVEILDRVGSGNGSSAGANGAAQPGANGDGAGGTREKVEQG